jgi:outer membrane protein assembly factor BamB
VRETLLGRALQPLPALLAAALVSPGCHSNGQAAGDAIGRTDGGPIAASTSVLEHHGAPSRAGVYAQAGVAGGALRLDPAFHAVVEGFIYAQPLFLDQGGSDLVIAVTEQNKVYALDARSGATVWSRTLGTPVPLARLPCGNIDPLGITGTPIVDAASRTLYLDAMTTPDGGATRRHLVFALATDDGSTRPGWPVDIGATARAGSRAFDSAVQNQRGALLLLNGILYVPYGGHFGDCGDYRGWVVGISTSSPAQVTAWATSGTGGGVWAPSGIASDGTSLYVATGNTLGASNWVGGEAIIRLAPGPVFGGQTSDYFAPSNWLSLDGSDTDLGGSGVVLINIPAASTPRLAAALGKDGNVYLVGRDNLGGIGTALYSSHVSSEEIIVASAVYTTANGTYLVFRGSGLGCPAGQSGDLVALQITPPAARVAWCASAYGRGSPMVTQSAGATAVWSLGAQGDGRLHAYAGDTGAPLGQSDAMGSIRAYNTPIAAKGRVFVGGDGAVYALLP